MNIDLPALYRQFYFLAPGHGWKGDFDCGPEGAVTNRFVYKGITVTMNDGYEYKSLSLELDDYAVVIEHVNDERGWRIIRGSDSAFIKIMLTA